MTVKIIIATLVSVFFAAIGTVCAQEAVVDAKGRIVPAELLRPVSAEFADTPVAEAIHELSVKAGFHLNYNQEIISARMKISAKYHNRPVFLILRDILYGAGIDIIVLNSEQLILTVLKKSEDLIAGEKFTLSGFVTDSQSGEALVGANIYIKETGSGYTTNSYGFYSLTLGRDVYLLRYS